MLLYIYFCKVSTLLVRVCESICKSLWCAIVCDCACMCAYVCVCVCVSVCLFPILSFFENLKITSNHWAWSWTSFMT